MGFGKPTLPRGDKIRIDVFRQVQGVNICYSMMPMGSLAAYFFSLAGSISMPKPGPLGVGILPA
ncbi:MAG: hypothetical protein GX629_04235 [Phycisphaerae bacterium]|nr:hypothetical protein [Phycisphaerae bacterium]